MSAAAPRVTICVATYGRPRGLERLLEGIAALTFRDRTPELSVIIADNSSGGCRETARVVSDFGDRLSRMTLVHEPQQGISEARNAALDAVEDTDFVAFIDDDEVPAAPWLDELLRVQDETNADVVAGPVVSCFENEPPPWIVAGDFFATPRRPTGSELFEAATHNVLYRWLPYGMEERFSARYSRSGGGDTHYFRRLHRRGARIVWADEAIVFEWQPPARQTVGWILRRQYRIGMMSAVIDEELPRYPSPRKRIVKEARVRITDGLRSLLGRPRAAKHERVAALARMAGGVGRIAALIGLGYEEYRG